MRIDYRGIAREVINALEAYDKEHGTYYAYYLTQEIVKPQTVLTDILAKILREKIPNAE